MESMRTLTQNLEADIITQFSTKLDKFYAAGMFQQNGETGVVN
jgi:hypothetical protein